MGNLVSRLGMLVDTARGKSKMRRFKRGWAGQTSSEIKFYRSPKIQYRYRERGSGSTIVFTADPPSTLELYDELLDIFGARYRVLVVELPAMGFSATQSDYRFGWAETNDDMASFLRDVAGEQSMLAFSCVAGLAAVDIASRYPNLVSRIVLMQTANVGGFARWKSTRDPKNILARPVIGQMIMKRLARARVGDWYRLSVGNQDKLDHFCTCALESMDNGALWSLASAYQVYMDPKIILGTPHQPILSIWGGKDGSHTRENAESAKTFSDNVRYQRFDNLGHFPELEGPKQVFIAIQQFCSDEISPGV